jgi:hypothetical protein
MISIAPSPFSRQAYHGLVNQDKFVNFSDAYCGIFLKSAVSRALVARLSKDEGIWSFKGWLDNRGLPAADPFGFDPFSCV